jgi:hypothetical protein
MEGSQETFAARRGSALQYWPLKAVSETPAGAKCEPFRFVSGHLRW